MEIGQAIIIKESSRIINQLHRQKGTVVDVKATRPPEVVVKLDVPVNNGVSLLRQMTLPVELVEKVSGPVDEFAGHFKGCSARRGSPICNCGAGSQRFS